MYAQAITAPQTGAEGKPPMPEPQRSALHKLPTPAAFPRPNHTGPVAEDPETLSAEEAMKCLMWYVDVPPTREDKNIETTIQVNFYVAHSKMGNATETWLARTFGGMETEGLLFE